MTKDDRSVDLSHPSSSSNGNGAEKAGYTTSSLDNSQESEKEDEFLIQLMQSIMIAFFLALAYRIYIFIYGYIYGLSGDDEL